MIITSLQKQPTRVVLMKTRSENMQQIYRRTLTPKCDFSKVALQSNFVEITVRHGFSPVNLLHIFRIPFTRNTSGWLLRYRVRTHLVYTGFDQNSGNCAKDKFGSNIMSSNVWNSYEFMVKSVKSLTAYRFDQNLRPGTSDNFLIKVFIHPRHRT